MVVAFTDPEEEGKEQVGAGEQIAAGEQLEGEQLAAGEQVAAGEQLEGADGVLQPPSGDVQEPVVTEVHPLVEDIGEPGAAPKDEEEEEEAAASLTVAPVEFTDIPIGDASGSASPASSADEALHAAAVAALDSTSLTAQAQVGYGSCDVISQQQMTPTTAAAAAAAAAEAGPSDPLLEEGGATQRPREKRWYDLCCPRGCCSIL